jgi:hypothetical protein
MDVEKASRERCPEQSNMVILSLYGLKTLFFPVFPNLLKKKRRYREFYPEGDSTC